ncbi:MAG: sulfatase-like hydrolase/transferase [Candidatus Sabulitectum sp.]|nr:sulfatase-like hydrolase/transferase [Candidatus Sabulitectum sp.]
MKRKTLLLIVIAIGLTVTASCGTEQRMNVLLILVDTVRADHLSCYGYHRNTTPYIDSLAAAGTVANLCQGQASWTLPAMATIMSGVPSVTHGAGRNSSGFHGISPDVPWLPLAFNGEGYRTGAFFNVMFMNADFGFHRGFQHFDCQGVASGNSLRKAGPTVDDFLAWLDSGDQNRSFFAAVHFYDPHIPYRSPEPFRSMYTQPDYTGDYGDSWGEGITEMMDVNSGEVIPTSSDMENLVALYDGEITYMDSEIGKLLAELRTRGMGENTLIVIAGDHGEEFLDHGGIEHGRTLYQETTHVPLIIAGPGFGGGRVISSSVAQLDIAGTIAAAAGIEFTTFEPSANLAGSVDPAREIPASGVLWRDQGDLVSIVSGNSKLIWSVEDDSLEMFDLSADPLEKTTIEPRLQIMEAAEFYWATPPMGEAPLVDYSETASRELRNLGYIR